MAQPTFPNRTLDLASVPFCDIVSCDLAPAAMGDLIWTAPEMAADEDLVLSFGDIPAIFRTEAPAGAIVSSLDSDFALAA